MSAVAELLLAQTAAVKRLVFVNTAFDGRPDYHFRAARDARNLAATVNTDVQRSLSLSGLTYSAR